MKVNNGIDAIALQSGGLLGGAFMTSAGGVTVGATSASLTSVTGPTSSSGGPPHNTGTLIGKTIVLGARYGVILQHTAGPPAVLTLDRWYDPTNPGGTAGSNPASGTYVITQNQPAAFMGLSVATLAVSAAHAFLTNDAATVSELWSTAGGIGLSDRKSVV